MPASLPASDKRNLIAARSLARQQQILVQRVYRSVTLYTSWTSPQILPWHDRDYRAHTATWPRGPNSVLIYQFSINSVLNIKIRHVSANAAYSSASEPTQPWTERFVFPFASHIPRGFRGDRLLDAICPGTKFCCSSPSLHSRHRHKAQPRECWVLKGLD